MARLAKHGNLGSDPAVRLAVRLIHAHFPVCNEADPAELYEAARVDGAGPVKPDVKPNPPGTPTGTFGDKRVTLSWTAATSDGSPVTSYTVEISPAAGSTTQQNVGGTSLTWTGLTNGTAYTFQVRANSDFPQPSDWSGNSAF